MKLEKLLKQAMEKKVKEKRLRGRSRYRTEDQVKIRDRKKEE